MARPPSEESNDWHARHARRSGADADSDDAGGVVRVRRPVWERDWESRHAHVRRLDDQ